MEGVGNVLQAHGFPLSVWSRLPGPARRVRLQNHQAGILRSQYVSKLRTGNTEVEFGLNIYKV